MDILLRIKELQKSQKLSTYMLAKKSGIAVNTIYNWFRLNYSPNLDSLKLLCEKGFEISLAQFFVSEDEIIISNNAPEVSEMMKNWSMLSNEQKEAVRMMIASYKKS